ncbi:MAG: hypothetical protein ACRDMX_15075 [Solirubrobacteraceae bacterium]
MASHHDHRRVRSPRVRARLRAGARCSLLAALTMALLAAPAQAAVGGRGRGAGSGGGRAARSGSGRAAVSARGRAAALAQLTGLRASQLRAADTCPPVATGHARCAAEAIVIRSDGQLVRPRIHRRRRLARIGPRFAGAFAAADAGVGLPAPTAGTPAYLQQAYDLTYLSQIAGGSDTVAVVDAYDDPTAASDLASFRATYGLPACTSASGCFAKVNQDGVAAPLPQADSNWETEISLDLDAISSLCPNCHILLVEAASTSMSDMQQAEIEAATLGARQISDSWSVDSFSPISGTYTFPGAAVLAATGDSGYDGPGWDAYPAALPAVTAVGGTSLTASTSAAPSARGFTESAWSLSGGWGGGSGCDANEARPSWQSDTGCGGRSYSDVSADADPATGLTVYDSGAGGWLLVGGTSLATPLVAAYEAVTGVDGTTPQWAYADSPLLNDPVTGSNGDCSISYICNAQPGFDGPTGAGSISGAVVAGAPGIGGPSVGAGDGNTYAQTVTPGTATLAAGIYPNSLATSYWWQYGPTAAYGQQTPAAQIGSGTAPTSIQTELTGLAAGSTYHCRLVAANADGTSYGYDFTVTTAAGPPESTAAPAISGAAQQGQTLTAASGAWSPSGTVAYQWLRSSDAGVTWAVVPGATAEGYTLAAADARMLVRVVVTASNQFGAGSAGSAAVGPVVAIAPSVPATPPAHDGSGGHRRRGAGSGQPSTVLSFGRRTIRDGHGGRLAIVALGQPVASAAARGRHVARRWLLVHRAPGVQGRIRVWACETSGADAHRCTSKVALRSRVRLRLPFWMHGAVRVFVSAPRVAQGLRRLQHGARRQR